MSRGRGRGGGEGTRYRSRQHAGVSTTAPSASSYTFLVLGLSSRTCHLVFSSCASPGPHPTRNNTAALPEELPSGPGPRGPPGPPSSCGPGSSFLKPLTLGCGYPHFPSSARPHAPHQTVSHSCPLKSSDAILVLVLRWEILKFWKEVLHH